NNPGGDAYRDNIAGNSCDINIAVGQTVDTEPGGMSGPTSQGVSLLCLGVHNVSEGYCPAPHNRIILPIWDQPAGIGQTTVNVRYIGAYVLTRWGKFGSDGHNADVYGYFIPFSHPDMGGFST